MHEVSDLNIRHIVGSRGRGVRQGDAQFSKAGFKSAHRAILSSSRPKGRAFFRTLARVRDQGKGETDAFVLFPVALDQDSRKAFLK